MVFFEVPFSRISRNGALTLPLTGDIRFKVRSTLAPSPPKLAHKVQMADQASAESPAPLSKPDHNADKRYRLLPADQINGSTGLRMQH